MDSISYRFISKVYDALEYTYFRKEETSPRRAVLHFIPEEEEFILDICAGTAANSLSIASERANARIIAIDRSEEMISIARRKIADANCKNIKMYSGDALSMDFENETFDFALISLVLHENSKEFNEKLLEEAARVLKKDGKLIVVEWEEPQTFLKKIFFFPIKLMEPKGFLSFLKMNMKVYFSKNGFQIKEVKQCDYSKVILLEKDSNREKTDCSRRAE